MLSLIGAFAVWVLWSLAPALAADPWDRASFPSDVNSQPDSNKQAEDWPITGPWIVEVQLKKNRMVENEARSKYNTYDENTRNAHPFKMKHSFVDPNEGGLNAVVLEGVSKTDLEQMPGVMSVTADFLLYASAYSWGVDRIDQTSLPLDRATYSPDYCGQGVDVYVLDTGIDTTHPEFRNNGRSVSNIWNAYGSITSNTDGNGHGTHCSGTVGGRTIGVARCANIYGMKVLSDAGSGYLSDVIAALNEVLRLHLLGPRKSVISLSLGGLCSGSCTNDLTVKRVNQLAGYGIVPVVAAGNSGADAVLYTPAAAWWAITVGASSNSDGLASWSNWGSRVDIQAPGVGIKSAKTGGGYTTYSGTSMACPHVAGVVAQELQKGAITMNNLEAVKTVTAALLCDSSDKIYNTRGSTTRALAELPSNDGRFTC